MLRFSKILWLLVCLPVVVGGSSGCSGCNKTASTPKEAIVNATRALEDGDRGTFIASVYISDDGDELAGALFDFVYAHRQLRKAMEKEYGEAPRGLMGGKDDDTADEVEEKVEITEEKDDTAKAKMPGKSSPTGLVKKDGYWKVDMSEMAPKAEEREKALKNMKAMAKAANDVRDKVGKEGYDADKIMLEMRKAMAEAEKDKDDD